MLARLASDLWDLGIELIVLSDVRIPTNGLPSVELILVDSAESLRACLQTQAARVGHVILIAPESSGSLILACQWVSDFHHKLASPDLSFVRLTTDKQETIQWLHDHGIRVPVGCLARDLGNAQNVPRLPWVIKPRFGAGSESVQLIQDRGLLPALASGENWRVEEFIAGQAVSVSVLCGLGSCELLTPTGQIFDDQPFGNYTGTKYPLAPEIARRATELAARTLEVLPPTRGYIGIDIVISDNGPDDDRVIEINPRLTMSYVKLSEWDQDNLAGRMLSIAVG